MACHEPDSKNPPVHAWIGRTPLCVVFGDNAGFVQDVSCLYERSASRQNCVATETKAMGWSTLNTHSCEKLRLHATIDQLRSIQAVTLVESDEEPVESSPFHAGRNRFDCCSHRPV